MPLYSVVFLAFICYETYLAPFQLQIVSVLFHVSELSLLRSRLTSSSSQGNSPITPSIELIDWTCVVILLFVLGIHSTGFLAVLPSVDFVHAVRLELGQAVASPDEPEHIAVAPTSVLPVGSSSAKLPTILNRLLTRNRCVSSISWLLKVQIPPGPSMRRLSYTPWCAIVAHDSSIFFSIPPESSHVLPKSS